MITAEDWFKSFSVTDVYAHIRLEEIRRIQADAMREASKKIQSICDSELPKATAGSVYQELNEQANKLESRE